MYKLLIDWLINVQDLCSFFAFSSSYRCSRVLEAPPIPPQCFINNSLIRFYIFSKGVSDSTHTASKSWISSRRASTDVADCSRVLTLEFLRTVSLWLTFYFFTVRRGKTPYNQVIASRGSISNKIPQKLLVCVSVPSCPNEQFLSVSSSCIRFYFVC